jgi:hypothetical protein
VIHRGRGGAFRQVRDVRRAVPLVTRFLLCGADLQRSKGMGSTSNSRPLLLTFNTGPQVVLEAFGACHHAAIFIRGRFIEGGVSGKFRGTVCSCFQGNGVTRPRVVWPSRACFQPLGLTPEERQRDQIHRGRRNFIYISNNPYTSADSDSFTSVFFVLYSKRLPHHVFWSLLASPGASTSSGNQLTW